jgi:hypothetical protein
MLVGWPISVARRVKGIHVKNTLVEGTGCRSLERIIYIGQDVETGSSFSTVRN